jgi:hypothetical protein
MREKSTSHGAPIIAALILLLAPLLYVGAYAALAMPMDVTLNVTYSNSPPLSATVRQVRYRVDGELIEALFAPVHGLDRRIRHQYWHPDA